jgi:hypothetical protein
VHKCRNDELNQLCRQKLRDLKLFFQQQQPQKEKEGRKWLSCVSAVELPQGGYHNSENRKERNAATEFVGFTAVL